MNFTKLYVAAALLPLTSGACAEQPEQIIKASVVTTTYIVAIHKSPTGNLVPVQETYWTGRRVLRQEDVCIEERQRLIDLSVVATDVGPVQVPSMERVRTRVECPG